MARALLDLPTVVREVTSLVIRGAHRGQLVTAYFPSRPREAMLHRDGTAPASLPGAPRCAASRCRGGRRCAIMERVNARHVIRKNGRRVAAFTGPVAAIAWLADETGFTQETVAEETRGNSALVDDVGHEWTITLEDA